MLLTVIYTYIHKLQSCFIKSFTYYLLHYMSTVYGSKKHLFDLIGIFININVFFPVYICDLYL